MELLYFGTTDRQPGHYIFKVMDHGLSHHEDVIKYNQLGFSPESLFKSSEPFGVVRYVQEAGYSILGICGSPVDKRRGSKSVFFVKGDYTHEQMESEIKNHPVAARLISKMPFTVNW